MTFELNDRECEFLRELLEATHKETLHEIHHTDTANYKRLLRDQVKVIEELRAKLSLEKART